MRRHYKVPSDFLTDADLLGGDFSPVVNLQMRLKRTGDVVLSLLLLLVTSPAILFSSLLIKINDGGPILYSQIRVGLRGRPYRI